ncbi:MAG: tRNA adenosine(34) deaminase TadA [Thermodesulfobacteriota bacterium]|nr:MAG: tRNA adenosine(34) deaminase TadA [Thermodesulfobacteriota bacterium]
MAEALKEARKAAKKGEVPVGALIVHSSGVIARGHNRREAACDPTGHAEMMAIRRAARALGSWRLTGCTLYVTLEPCLMCMGALLQARVGRLVFASFDPKAGACGSLYDLSNDSRLNHRVRVASGVMGAEATAALKSFFSELRAAKRSLKERG